MIRPLKDRVDELTRCAILEALAETEGNQYQAARLLGIHASTIYHLMLRHGIPVANTGKSPQSKK